MEEPQEILRSAQDDKGAAERPFVILPSIDLRQGKVVDLFQGDYARETVYEVAGEAIARRFIEEGAHWIHVVDLDGSQAGSPANRLLVQRIVEVACDAGAKVELGGGIRSLDAVRAALESGVTRVIVGTAAVEHPELVRDAVREFGAEALIVGIDARRGIVATRGWTAATGRRAIDVAQEMVDLGVIRFIYTDIERDSTLTAPNFEELAALAAAVPARVVAAGGVTTAAQIARLAGMGLEGAIVGSALYSGKITLPEALQAAKR